MKIVKEYYPRWIEILKAMTVPSGHQPAIDELISVLSNPFYQFFYWEKRPGVPFIKGDKSYEWPARWMPSQNKMRHYAPSWFLAYTPSDFGLAINWSKDKFDLYGDIKKQEPTQSVCASTVSHIMELEFSRTFDALGAANTQEPTNAYYYLENRQHWNLALSVSCPATERDKMGYNALKTLLLSESTFVIPWIVPPTYTEQNVWSEPNEIVVNPSPFLSLGVDSNNDCLFGLSYWWEKSAIKVYGGVQHRLRQKMRLIDRNKIKRIAVIDINRFEKTIDVKPTLSVSMLFDIKERSNASVS